MAQARDPSKSRRPHAHRAWLAALCLLATMAWALAQPAREANRFEDGVPRHPLELAALTDPDAVLARLPAELAAARQRNDAQALALLYLAQANACRVKADWTCQRSAGAAASAAAQQARQPILLVRGLIAEGRAAMAQQDYTRGERLLGEAELVLKAAPAPELAAEVFLAYSSLSDFIGKQALSIEYAERGLAQLPGDLGLPTQLRLLRNLARAQTKLGQLDSARLALERAIARVGQVDDPKLYAELLLEGARLARLRGDLDTQVENANKVLSLSKALANSQLLGLGHETLGLAAKDRHDLASAERELRLAYRSFRRLALDRDERRALSELLQVMVAANAPATALGPRLDRLLALDKALETSERAQASDDFDARLKYAQQQMDVERLQVESKMAKEREASLAQASRLSTALAALIGVVVVALAVFFVQQRRSNQRLQTAFAKLDASQAQTQDLLRLNPGYVLLADLEGRIQQANPAFAFALGCSPKAVVGRMLHEFLAGAGEQVQAEYLQRVLAQRKDDCLLAMCDAQGHEMRWRLSSRLSAPQTGPAYIVGTAIDVTEQVHQAEVLRAQSLHDALTGCYNRRYLDEFAQRRAGSRWAAIGIDLNGFKQINDELGHERGDQVLQEIARFLSDRVRGEDAVVRLGGDEFLILLAQADEATVARLVDRLQQDADQAACGFSLGAALREDAEPLASTLARADAGMYEAKRRHHRRKDDLA